jgi:hypothetical protein
MLPPTEVISAETLSTISLIPSVTARVVSKETGKDARTAHIQLLHDAEHPSVLELPVVN